MANRGCKRLLLGLALVCIARQCLSEQDALVHSLDVTDPSDSVDAVSDQAADQGDKLQAAAIKSMGATASEDAAKMEEPDAAKAVGKVADVANQNAKVSDDAAAQQAVTPAAQADQKEVPDNNAQVAQAQADSAATPKVLSFADGVKKASVADIQAQTKAAKESAAQSAKDGGAHIAALAKVANEPALPVQQESQEKADDQSSGTATDGFHMIPGMTIDSPAISKISGATLEDCIKACKTARQCSGVQFSQDKGLKGGNCLIMENRVQFSETFDYYERPGVTGREIEKTDQSMRKKWKLDQSEGDLGGLSASDIPGSKVLDPAQIMDQGERAALKKAGAAIAKINSDNLQRDKSTVRNDKKNVNEQTKAVADSTKKVQDLAEHAEFLQKKATDLSNDWKKSDLESAQHTLELSEVSQKSRVTTERLNTATGKVKQYADAASAYQAAGNPEATKMEAESTKWKNKINTDKADLLKYDAQRLKLEAKVEAVKAKTAKFKQDSDWATNDHQDTEKKLQAAQLWHRDASKALEETQSKFDGDQHQLENIGGHM